MQTERKIYLGLALVGLVGTWSYNIRFFLEDKPGMAFVSENLATPANLSLSLDIILMTSLLFLWMAREARRYGIRHLWAYLLGSLGVAICVAFPLFLQARRKALESRAEIREPTRLTALYPLVSGAAFVIIFIHRWQFAERGGTFEQFLGDLFRTPATSSITIDWVILGIVLITFAAFELRRLRYAGFRRFVLMNVFGLAVGMPWILRAIDVREEPARTPASGEQT